MPVARLIRIEFVFDEFLLGVCEPYSCLRTQLRYPRVDRGNHGCGEIATVERLRDHTKS
jgi:hypothetical protein